jgi:PST family polysaccharide transporter
MEPRRDDQSVSPEQSLGADPTVGRERALGSRHLGHVASRGVAVTLGGMWGRTAVQLISTVVLARLLDPADFGLVAMVMAIVGVADLVRDFGLTGAILQAKELHGRVWRSLLWFSLVLGTVLMITLAILAPTIARFYGEEQLTVLTLAIAPTLLINGLAMPLQARVQRDLRFGALASLDVVSMVIGVASAIVAALLGWGVWSLVLLSGAGQVYRLIALWVLARPKFGRPVFDRAVFPLLRTGGSIFGVQLLNYAARNVDNVVIGNYAGPAALGYYTRASALFLLPLQQLNGPLGRVALPVLSRLQDDPDRYRRYIRASSLVIAYFAFPTYAVAAATADPLIEILLGPSWGPTATLFALLSIAGVAQAIGNLQGWLYISLARAHRQLVYFVVTRPIVIGGFFLGAWWNGTEGLALVYGLTSLALLVPGVWLAIRGTFVRASDIVAPIVRPAVVAPFMFIAAFFASRAVDAGAFLQLLVGCVAGLLPLALAFAIPAFRRDACAIFAFTTKMRRPAQVS